MRFSRKRLVILINAVLIIVFSTVLAAITQGSWATILSLTLTAIGVVLALCQLAFPTSFVEREMPIVSSEEPVNLPATIQDYKFFRDQLMDNLNNSNFGTLVLYGNENIVGCSVFIYVRIFDMKAREYLNDYRDLKCAPIAHQSINQSSFYLRCNFSETKTRYLFYRASFEANVLYFQPKA